MLTAILNKYKAYRYANNPESAVYAFGSRDERFTFIKLLNEVGGVEYMLFGNPNIPSRFRIEIFLNHEILS